MKEKKALEYEKAELNALINKGVSFEVADTQIEVKCRFFGLIKKRAVIEIKRQFKIEEPTLGTLDRLSAEWIEFAIDEASLQSNDGIERARTMVHEHALRCAKVIAIAVLGSKYLVPKMKHGVVVYVEDNESLNNMTSLFARTIKPSKLYKLYVLISAMANIGDFLNSIRLMSTERTTMPIRVEGKTKG